jgi:hypothetical protein
MWLKLKRRIEYFVYGLLILWSASKKNSPLHKVFHRLTYPDNLSDKVQLSKLYLMCQSSAGKLTFDDYNRPINVDEPNAFTIHRVDLTNTALHDKAVECLTKLLQANTVLHNDVPVTLDQCVILDCFSSTVTKFNSFHTDLEYANFTGTAFNVWYLTENNFPNGNMFLLQTPDYTKDKTPCFLVDDFETGIPIFRHGLLGTYEHCGDAKNVKITYTNMKNGECLVMSKHLFHRTDLSRDPSFKGFNFRVLVKNADQSIDYANKYYRTRPYHRFDEATHRLFGCKLLDFI